MSLLQLWIPQSYDESLLFETQQPKSLHAFQMSFVQYSADKYASCSLHNYQSISESDGINNIDQKKHKSHTSVMSE
jgi:hypothetical protein